MFAVTSALCCSIFGGILDVAASGKVKVTILFVVQAVRKITLGQSVGKIIIIILSFWVGTSKNKNIDHRVKETSVFELKRHLFTCDSKMSSALKIFSVFHCNLKE